MSLWVHRTWTHYQLISWDWLYWFLSLGTVSAPPFRMPSYQHTPSTVDGFCCHTPAIHTDQSMESKTMHAKRLLGHRFVDLRLLNHIGPVSISSSPLDIRWPRHFTFLSCFVMNEVSGKRCFPESSSKTQQQQQKKDSQAYFPSHLIALNFPVVTWRNSKSYFIH